LDDNLFKEISVKISYEILTIPKNYLGRTNVTNI